MRPWAGNRWKDRLDLFWTINTSQAPWALDFPFALPADAYRALGLRGWDDLLNLALEHERDSFCALLGDRLSPRESRCRERSAACRLETPCSGHSAR